MSQKPTKCCGQNALISDQCGDCPSKRYLPSHETLTKLGFWLIDPASVRGLTGHYRRPQPGGGYLQLVAGISTGIIVISDNYQLEEGGWMKENHWRDVMDCDEQLIALLNSLPTE